MIFFHNIATLRINNALIGYQSLFTIGHISSLPRVAFLLPIESFSRRHIITYT